MSVGPSIFLTAALSAATYSTLDWLWERHVRRVKLAKEKLEGETKTNLIGIPRRKRSPERVAK